MTKKVHVHFMGIGGSGIAAIAVIAKKMGFKVTGCDYSESSYASTLINNNIEIINGHNVLHLKGVDILAVSPAIFDINPNHAEVLEGRRRGILMTWQAFMGTYLHQDKFVIAIAGTHGKSTTTVLAGLALEAGGLNPIVQAGSIYKPWGGGFRIAESDYFVTEADEFNLNFLNYKPSIVIINNIEMDHPEFFNDFEDFKNGFIAFIKNMKCPGTLVVNEESLGVREVLVEMKPWLLERDITLVGYYLQTPFDFPFHHEYQSHVTNYHEDSVDFTFRYNNIETSFNLGILGDHNVSNASGVICGALALDIEIDVLKEAFRCYKGISRRTELIDVINGIKVFDDYGHHPTAIGAVLDMFKTVYPDRKLHAIVEPHQLSRLKLFPSEFVNAFNKADDVIVTKSFIGREINKNLEPVDMIALTDRVKDGKAVYIEDFDDVANKISSTVEKNEIIVVFGAGKSYKLTGLIVDQIHLKYKDV